jgi:hypothetical protein
VLLRALEVLIVCCQDLDRVLLQQQLGLDLREARNKETRHGMA